MFNIILNVISEIYIFNIHNCYTSIAYAWHAFTFSGVIIRYMYTDNLTLLYNCPTLRLVDNTMSLFDNVVRVLRRSLKKRKSECDIAMFRKSWS